MVSSRSRQTPAVISPSHHLTISPLTTSPNTYPLAGFHPEDMRRDAGAYSATRGPLVAAPGDPRGPPREPCGLSRTSRSGGCLSAPACGDFGPGPRFGIRHSPAVPHGRDRHGTPYSPVETVATHGIAAATTGPSGRSALAMRLAISAMAQAKARWRAAAPPTRSRRPPSPPPACPPAARPAARLRTHIGRIGLNSA